MAVVNAGLEEQMTLGNEKQRTMAIAPDRFFTGLDEDARTVKDLLWPLNVLTPRERAVFTEYHYWKTHMKVIAGSHKISLGRAYELLYRGEEKLAASRAEEKTAGPDSL